MLLDLNFYAFKIDYAIYVYLYELFIIEFVISEIKNAAILLNLLNSRLLSLIYLLVFLSTHSQIKGVEAI